MNRLSKARSKLESMRFLQECCNASGCDEIGEYEIRGGGRTLGTDRRDAGISIERVRTNRPPLLDNLGWSQGRRCNSWAGTRGTLLLFGLNTRPARGALISLCAIRLLSPPLSLR